MTKQEAIEIINVATAEIEWEYPIDYAEAFDLAKESIKKQIPKKPSHFKYTAMKGYPKCPCCNTSGCVSDKVEINSFTLDKSIIYGGIKNNYCTECGQAIDWSE